MAHRTGSPRPLARPSDDAYTLAQRFARSAAATEGAGGSVADVRAWFDRWTRGHDFAVDRIPFAALDQWRFHPGTGNLVHDTGRFFSIEGIRARTNQGEVPHWCQPIIRQPEVGILGILVCEIEGVLHLLMQAKMEPGNANLVQLSPTVQATRSNYTRVHNGAPTPYLEHFATPEPGRVLVDALQSEQGAWFLGKRNRNMIVEAGGPVPLREDFHWLTLGQIHQLLAVPDLVNMDARTVLSHIPLVGECDGGAGTRTDAALAGGRFVDGPARHRHVEILSWINERRLASELEVERLPLNRVERWHRNDVEIAHDTGAFFTVRAVAVRADGREVRAWSQPMIEPRGQGLVAFLVREIDGVLHALVHARVEAGCRDTIELAPTVQCQPDNYRAGVLRHRPLFLDRVLGAPDDAVRFRTVLSEEGGRFYRAQTRYAIVAAPDLAPADHPPEYRWMTAGQLTALLPHSGYINVQARSLLACLQSLR